MSNELNVEFLGSIPLDPLLARCCDEGKNVLTEMPDSPTVNALKEICKSKFLISQENIWLSMNYKTKQNFASRYCSKVWRRERELPW